MQCGGTILLIKMHNLCLKKRRVAFCKISIIVHMCAHSRLGELVQKGFLKNDKVLV